MPVLESKKLSILETATWQITANCDTTAITYGITGSIESAMTIGSIKFFLKFAIYYYHERLWTKIKLS